MFAFVGVAVLFLYPAKKDEKMLEMVQAGIGAHERGESAEDPITGTYTERVIAPASLMSDTHTAQLGAGEMVPPPRVISKEMGGHAVINKLDHYTSWELSQVVKRGSKSVRSAPTTQQHSISISISVALSTPPPLQQFLVCITGIYTLVALLLVVGFAAAAGVDLSVAP